MSNVHHLTLWTNYSKAGAVECLMFDVCFAADSSGGVEPGCVLTMLSSEVCLPQEALAGCPLAG